MRRLRRLRSKSRKKSRKIMSVGSAAILAVGSAWTLSNASNSSPPDPHQLAAAQDADGDLLADREEYALGYRAFEEDQNQNGIPDGVELAQRCARLIQNLPVYHPSGPKPNKTYKIEHALDGLEQCDVCGQEIHMGGWEIINPKLDLHYPDSDDPMNSIFLPDLAIHYLEHGSFGCAGTEHTGRVEVARLLRVLEIRYPSDLDLHQLPLKDPNDVDGDWLTDREELKIYTNPYHPDQNHNITLDVIDLAQQCLEEINRLPTHQEGIQETYKEEFLTFGLETCEICSHQVNMGFVHIVNPQLHLEIDIPFIILHYMKHGSFSYAGDVHGRGRLDTARLVQVLELPRRCGDLKTLYLPGDGNEDCRINLADVAALAGRWLECTEPNEPGCLEY
jgi:hypothetical protein